MSSMSPRLLQRTMMLTYRCAAGWCCADAVYSTSLAVAIWCQKLFRRRKLLRLKAESCRLLYRRKLRAAGNALARTRACCC